MTESKIPDGFQKSYELWHKKYIEVKKGSCMVG